MIVETDKAIDKVMHRLREKTQRPLRALEKELAAGGNGSKMCSASEGMQRMRVWLNQRENEENALVVDDPVAAVSTGSCHNSLYLSPHDWAGFLKNMQPPIDDSCLDLGIYSTCQAVREDAARFRQILDGANESEGAAEVFGSLPSKHPASSDHALASCVRMNFQIIQRLNSLLQTNDHPVGLMQPDIGLSDGIVIVVRRRRRAAARAADRAAPKDGRDRLPLRPGGSTAGACQDGPSR